MTQKELSYIEDAIGHETNIITICEDSIEDIEDANIVNFIDKEIKKHTKIKDKLMKVLKESSNEWSGNTR